MNDASEEETLVKTGAATQTDWHRLLALLQEAALVPVALEVLTELLADLKPIKIDMVLLRRKSAQWTAEQVARLPDGIRQSVANHILCEFKYTQSVNHATLVQALIYDFLYRSSRKLARKKVATFVVSARTPRPAVLEAFGYVATEWPGVYRSTQTLLAPITLLVLNQLSREPHNALFKVFASQGKEREASFALLEQIGAKQWAPELGEVLTGLQTLLQQQEGGKMKGMVIDPDYVKQLGREMEATVLANLTTEKTVGEGESRADIGDVEPRATVGRFSARSCPIPLRARATVGWAGARATVGRAGARATVGRVGARATARRFRPGSD